MKRFLDFRRYVRLDRDETRDQNLRHSNSSIRWVQYDEASLSTAHELQRCSGHQSQSAGEELLTNSELVEASDTVPTEPAPTTQHEAGEMNTGYDPLYIRRWVLLCFAVLWTMVIISLQVTYTISEARKGLTSPRDSLRYLWTYGPTALLVVVTVLWRQVDYVVKHLQPWA